MPAQLVQLEAQLGEPLVALVELSAQLAVGFRRRALGRLFGRGRGAFRCVARDLELVDELVALDELAAQLHQAVLVFLDLRVDRLGFRAPEIDFFLRELLGTGFGDLELFLELRNFDALRLGDFF